MFRIICLVIGYFLGSFPTAYLVGRALAGVDIRTLGSGNMGTNNAASTLGMKAGALTLLGDLVKMLLAVLLCRAIFPQVAWPSVVLYAGIGAVMGHDFPCWLKFRGGKGVAVTLAFVLLFDWRVALCVYAVSLVCMLATRYVAVGSSVLAASFPVFVLVFERGSLRWEAFAISAALGILMLVRHRGNFQRIIHGTERRLPLFPKKEAGAGVDAAS